MFKNPYKNPYYYWWKVRKFWKMPKIHLAHIGEITWWFGLPCSREHYNKYLDISISGLGWKDKDNEPRFEWDPYFCITLFRKWQIIWVWNYCPYFMKQVNKAIEIETSIHTWEAILSMVEYEATYISNPSLGHYKDGKWVDTELPVTSNLTLDGVINNLAVNLYGKGSIRENG